ncbi:hypothetical protein THAR02_04117 [Trichoderma harzianum]|uniref:Uncharacterized protein n=1 Tax=Trichoderma harzianum TaxID=5544 RepID=A0A0F9ZUB9_TRIHA|nr:hypothetical protein THAR02_04117 [Trichoderma harzianum]
MSPANIVKVGPANPQTQSLLMQLPRELRNYIYASLFSSTRFTSGERHDVDSVIFRFIPAPHGLALLLSCRRAYIEIGKSWVSQVLFCFESGRGMVDKLGDIPLETRSMIRHIRVSADLLAIGYDDRYVQYDTHQALKLLPGLKLDRLTVCSITPPETSYDILSRLVEHSDGWKELCYKSHASDFLGYKPDRHSEERGLFLREPQPGGWQRKLEGRDGSESGASVTIYQSNVSYMRDFDEDLRFLEEFEPHVSNTGTWVKFTQALAPNQDIKDYQKVADRRLMVYGEIGKEMLVVVKRGRGVDYEEKEGSPYIKAGDIRAAFPGKTWGEIKACDDRIEDIICQGISHHREDSDWDEEYMDVMDVYTHVDDYVFPPLPEFRWMIG